MNVKEKILNSRAKKNQKYTHTSLEMGTSTHFPMLIKAVQMTEGPVLEMGSGMFSTPLLHWLCFENKRKLITVEHYPHYLDFAKKFETEWHEVQYLDPREIFKPKEQYAVVFIDHSPKPPRTRGDDALLFKYDAKFVILHDAGKDGHKKYGYDKIYPEFMHRYDWNGCWPSTTVLSNWIDLSQWNSPS